MFRTHAAPVRLFIALGLALLWMLLAPPPGHAVMITSAGPVTEIAVSPELSCNARYAGDTEYEFFGGDGRLVRAVHLARRRRVRVRRLRRRRPVPGDRLGHERRPAAPDHDGVRGNHRRVRCGHGAARQPRGPLRRRAGLLPHGHPGHEPRPCGDDRHLPVRRLLPAELRQRLRLRRRPERRDLLPGSRREQPACVASRGLRPDQRRQQLLRGALFDRPQPDLEQPRSAASQQLRVRRVAGQRHGAGLDGHRPRRVRSGPPRIPHRLLADGHPARSGPHGGGQLTGAEHPGRRHDAHVHRRRRSISPATPTR